MFKRSRRAFLTTSPALAGIPVLYAPQAGGPAAGPPPTFPAQDPGAVREVVGAAHGNFDRVRELVDARPALAKAVWDWGFGDWESALGAASHTGNRDIATYLIDRGARPTLFSATMLGQLDVVQAFVTASPGAQRIPGPHGITLLTHAELGGPQARAVFDYLTALGDADPRPESVVLSDEARDALIGVYIYGPEPGDRLEVSVVREAPMIRRAGGTNRGLRHLGNLVFSPAGADAVRIAFSVTAATATVTITDGPVEVVGRRAASLLPVGGLVGGSHFLPDGPSHRV